jgi:hypothetical protein
MIYATWKALLLFAIIFFGAVAYMPDATALAQVTSSAKAPDVAEQSIGSLLCIPDKNNPGKDLSGCINKLYRFAVAIGGIGAVLMIVIAGYMYITGGAEQIHQAKSMIGTSIWGIVIILASYGFLRMINPTLVEFRSIQPPINTNVAPLKSPEEYGAQWCLDFPNLCEDGKPIIGDEAAGGATGGSGSERSRGSVKTGDGSKPGANQTGSELRRLGCIFDPGVEVTVPKITASLYQMLKSICSATVNSGKEKPRISSLTGGKHSAGSLHYSGCAADFGNNTYTDTGKKIIQVASSLGMVVNPGTDAKQTYHIHVSIGNHCGDSPS